MKKLILILILLLLLPGVARAADPACGAACTKVGTVYTCTDITRNCIQDAVTAATTGDTINLASGSATWYQGVTRVHGGGAITLHGEGATGAGKTEITSAITGALYERATIDLEDTASRVTGISMIATTNYNYIIAEGQGFLIDNCKFSQTFQISKLVILVQPYSSTHNNPSGVIWKNTFINSGVIVYGSVYSYLSGATTWYGALGLGSADAVYIEGNTASIAAPKTAATANFIDSNSGGKYVARWNDVTDMWLMVHSADPPRAGRKWEMYYNKFVGTGGFTSLFYPASIRGGTGVYFGNTVTGSFNDTQPYLDNTRSYAMGDANMLQCNGSSTVDGNTAITAAIYGSDSTGVHGGGDGATLHVAGKAWTANKLVGITVYNLADAGAKCIITGNTDHTVTCTLAGGTRDHWHDGDTFKITDGWPCRDQIGRGADAAAMTEWATPSTQTTQAAHAWGNTGNFIVGIGDAANMSQWIRNGFDYFNEGVSGAYPGPFTHADGMSYTARDCPDPRAAAVDATLTGATCDPTTTGASGYGISGGGDVTAPSVTAFVIPSTAASLSVAILSFTCTDAVGVTGYCATSVNSSIGCSWSGSAPSTMTFSSTGAQTGYGWCKDLAGNISAASTDTTVITLPRPAIMTGGSCTGCTVTFGTIVAFESYTNIITYADASLSGTPILIKIITGGVPYYTKAYPSISVLSGDLGSVSLDDILAASDATLSGVPLQFTLASNGVNYYFTGYPTASAMASLQGTYYLNWTGLPATTLSGTPRVVRMYINGTPYYMKVYPTKE
jgi:hypothetical protein